MTGRSVGDTRRCRRMRGLSGPGMMLVLFGVAAAGAVVLYVVGMGGDAEGRLAADAAAARAEEFVRLPGTPASFGQYLGGHVRLIRAIEADTSVGDSERNSQLQQAAETLDRVLALAKNQKPPKLAFVVKVTEYAHLANPGGKDQVRYVIWSEKRLADQRARHPDGRRSDEMMGASMFEAVSGPMFLPSELQAWEQANGVRTSADY